MYFEVLGVDSPDAQTIVLSSGLGGSANFWQAQLKVLTEHYRVVVYDHLGTGRSPAQLPCDYRIQHMANELLALLDQLDITQCHLMGHALGGLVALEIALQRPEILHSIILINAWSSPNPHTLRCFNIRKSILANSEKDIFLQMQALLLFPPDWIVENIKTLQEEEQHLLNAFPDKDNLLARIGALSEFDIDEQLSSIKTDTWVIANKDDLLVPWQRSQHLAASLPNARLSMLDYGGHASTITVSSQFNALLIDHLNKYCND